jgi:hypothetical protein
MNPRTIASESTTLSDDSEELASHMKDLMMFLSENLEYARDEMKKYADVHRRPSPSYKPGDKVMLSTENIKSRRPKAKWSDKRMGPFMIVKEAHPESDAYVLDIPTSWQIHPVFHASLLTRFIEDHVPERSQPPPPSVMVDGHEEFVIEKFLDWKPTRGNAMQFLVKWLGYDDPKENSWMHEGYLEECGTHLEDFFKRCPEARDYFENRTRVPPKKKRRARS